MATNVLAIIIAIVWLSNSNANGSEYSVKSVITHDNYEQLKDNSISKWDDLHNEINQGDALTYELGTPKYEILNPDEPIEIITAGQPGYEESLRRYEQDAARSNGQINIQEIRNSTELTTREPALEIEEISSERGVSQVPKDDEKIKFIIFNSQKKHKNRLYVEVTKDEEQPEKVTGDETSDKQKSVENIEDLKHPLNNRQREEDEQLGKGYADLQLKDSMGSHVLNDTKSQELNDTKSAIEFATTTEQPPISNEDETANDHTTETVSTIVPSTTAVPSIYQVKHSSSSEQVQQEAISNIPISAEREHAEAMPNTPIIAQVGQGEASSNIPLSRPMAAPHNSPPIFLALGTRMSDMMGPLPNGDAEITYKVIPQTPPHIRDFEYLYRSALASD